MNQEGWKHVHDDHSHTLDDMPVMRGGSDTHAPGDESTKVRPSVVLDMNRGAVRALVERFPTTNPRLFGSVLRGTDREDSDIDLLVDALPNCTLLHLADLQDQLEALLCTRVDLLTLGDLPEKFRSEVLAEARPV